MRGPDDGPHPSESGLRAPAFCSTTFKNIVRIFYIANDEFTAVGHPWHTLKSLCYGNAPSVVLMTHPQSGAFRATLPRGCKLVECLPTSEKGREVAPHVLGARIADELLRQGITGDDLIVLKMPFPYLLLSVLYTLALSRVSVAAPRLSVLVSQTDEGYASEPILYSHCFAILRNLPAPIRERVALLHEREALRQYWQELFPELRMGVCGYVTEWFKPAADASGQDAPRLCYLGEARAEKGFLTLADVVAGGALRCALDVHRDANPVNATPAYEDAVRAMEAARGRGLDLRLIHQRRDSCYEAAFHPSSVALMLYSPEYRLRGSGVLQECAASGMYVIAYEDLGFHLDFPDNVLTVTRGEDPHALGEQIQARMDQIAADPGRYPRPNVLTADAFRQLLLSPHAQPAGAPSQGRIVFVLTNNVHRQGCSKIIEAQQDEVVQRGLAPAFISFEWPDPGLDWSELMAFHRVWTMQMISPGASYGRHHLCVPLIASDRVAQQYDTYQYKELVQISRAVRTDILDSYLTWRDDPVVIQNYVHHTPILEGKVDDLERIFLEIHDITSVQQRIRTNDEDATRFEESMALEVADLRRFAHKAALSDDEVAEFARRGCPMVSHSYMDVFLRNAQRALRAAGHAGTAPKGFQPGEYLCIVASDHPSNVLEINRFCAREAHNAQRRLPIVICGLVCQRITVPQTELAAAGIHLLGFVEDVSGILEGAVASLNPVDIGSGVPIKVLESVVHETPCLVTPRTLVAMQGHPLVVQYAFEGNPISDEQVRELAATARKNFERSRGEILIRPNQLGVFLDEHCAAQS